MTRCLQLIERSRNILGANGQLCRRVMLGRALCEPAHSAPHTNTEPFLPCTARTTQAERRISRRAHRKRKRKTQKLK